VFADGVSGVRSVATINAYNTFLGAVDFPVPEVVIRLGNVPTSKAMNSYLDKLKPPVYIQVSEDGVWADDSHRVTHLLHISADSLVNQLADRQKPTVYPELEEIEVKTWQAIDAAFNQQGFFDATAVYDAVNLADEMNLFVGNSLAVRHVDSFSRQRSAYANRGASGIDGNISTALGIGKAQPDKPLVAIVGDITFYHDMNGLLAVHRIGVPVTVVLLNNNGGGIFHRLPINQFDPDFTDYFITPHGLDFSHAARLYGLDYCNPTSRDEFQNVLTASIRSQTSTLIEVKTDSQEDYERYQALMAVVKDRL
jgi:2-succinyl-5-enolpyruvyl-6-hydroxy-3-cyclohexene-1-carboxylate synthase